MIKKIIENNRSILSEMRTFRESHQTRINRPNMPEFQLIPMNDCDVIMKQAERDVQCWRQFLKLQNIGQINTAIG